jgi:hypothetical protein
MGQAAAVRAGRLAMQPVVRVANVLGFYSYQSWDQIFIDLGARGTAIVRLSQSFWSRCTELRSAAVGRWLLERGLAPWPDGEPPRLELRRRDGNRFSLSDQPADFTA